MFIPVFIYNEAALLSVYDFAIAVGLFMKIISDGFVRIFFSEYFPNVKLLLIFASADPKATDLH